jgi:hypothetical protein
MKKILFLLAVILHSSSIFSQVPRIYDTYDGCTGWCNYDKNIDKASVDARFDQCMETCYISTAYDMGDILIRLYPNYGYMFNEVLSSAQFRMCTEECKQRKGEEMWDVETAYFACKTQCCAEYPNDCSP